ncbi:MAG: hypothetical protein CXZ00_15155 [Acidobacteria bacterium]|mgnify:CR=1 FL=1|nr:MAG: hypothetical protein CXZ00_15155 [Acidobacteriota bacterium]
MNQESTPVRKSLKAPRAAAIAGIIFAVLLITSQLLIRISLPDNTLGPATDVLNQSKTISIALNLVPFAGIAFLWFIGVMRDRFGEQEDRFFATVFLGSGLLYVAMMFVFTALAGGLVKALGSEMENLVRSGTYALTRAEIYEVANVFGPRMAAVFMISTGTISLKIGIAPRWLAFLGYALALALLLGVGIIGWVPMVFPVWIFLMSVYILVDNLR